MLSITLTVSGAPNHLHHIGKHSNLPGVLQKLPLSDDADKKYITCIVTWKCTCPGFKYSACLLCKHLVQAVGDVPPLFFIQVARRRTTPFYSHKALTGAGYVNAGDGSISDGDDYTWSGNPEDLRGGGGWEEFDFDSTVLLGKRSRPDSDDETIDEEVRRGFSPDRNDSEAGQGLLFDNMDSEDEEEVSFCSNQTAANLIICVQCQKNSVLLLERAEELQRAAQIFSAQAAAKDLIWMRSVVRRDNRERCEFVGG
jgi:hypothetical protein